MKYKHKSTRQYAVSRFLLFTGNIPGVENGRPEGDDSDGFFDLRRDVSHSGADDLEDGPGFSADQMQFVDDEQIHALNVLSLLPTTRQNVPSFGSGNDHVA